MEIRNSWNNSKILILGHRGFRSRYPENTILSFMEAVKHGADGIELDVWLTKDCELVIAHDEDLCRVAGVERKIKEMDLGEIKKIELGEGQTLPTLKEVFDALPEKAIINVELKDAEAVEKTIKLIEERGIEDRIEISSFNIDALREVRKFNRSVRLGLLIDDEKLIPQIPSLAQELTLYSVNLPIDALEFFSVEAFRGTIIRMRELGLKIVLWADKDELYYENDNILKLKDIVDVVITDDVERMRVLLS